MNKSGEHKVVYYVPNVVYSSRLKDAPIFKNVLTGVKLQEMKNSIFHNDLAFLEFLQALMTIVDHYYFDYIGLFEKSIILIIVARRQIQQSNSHDLILTQEKEIVV